MGRVAKAVQSRQAAPDLHYDQATAALLAVAGALFTLLGLVLVLGGYLSAVGSAFHILAGVGLIVSGSLVARRHPAAVWTYMLVFATIVAWSLRDVEVGSTLAQRLIGPTLLLAMLAVLMPPLCRWRPGQSFALFALLVAATVGLGLMTLPNGPLASQAAALTQLVDTQTKGDRQ